MGHYVPPYEVTLTPLNQFESGLGGLLEPDQGFSKTPLMDHAGFLKQALSLGILPL